MLANLCNALGRELDSHRLPRDAFKINQTAIPPTDLTYDLSVTNSSNSRMLRK